MRKSHKKEIRVLTIQVVMDILEDLVPIERIITLAHYTDHFDIRHMADILQMSLDNIKCELGIANEYIKTKCLEYELQNNCKLAEVDDCTINEAFIELFKQDRYLINSK